MLPIIKKPPISHRRKAIAVGIAGAADLLQIALLPAMLPGYVLDDAIDVIVALILVAVCGFKWQFVLAFLIELVPGLDLFPTWTALALLLPSTAPDAPQPQTLPADPTRVTVTRIPPVQSPSAAPANLPRASTP